MARNSIIGNLRVNLGIDSASFQAGLSNATKGLAAFEKTAVKIGAAIGTALTASLGVVAVSVKKTIDGVQDAVKSAQLSNAGIEEFQRLAYAAKTVGIESQKLADVYKDVNDRIGDFWSTGGGPMADFFEKIAPKVGVTAQAFRDLSGPQALQLYYDTLVKAGASQQDMTFYMEAMASDATALIPLLQNGGTGFKKLGDEAERFGVVINEQTAQAAVEFQKNLDRIGAAKDGMITKVTAHLLPALELLSERFLAFVNDEDVVRAVADGMGKAFAWVARQAAHLAVLIDRLKVEFNGLKEAVVKFYNFDFSGGVEAWNAGQTASARMRDELNVMLTAMEDGVLRSQGSIQRRISGAFGDAGTAAATEFNTKLSQFLAGGAGKSAIDAMKAEGERLAESLRTPLETYIAQYDRYKELLDAGAISQETFNRAVAASGLAFEQAEQAGRKTENVFISIGQTIAQSFGSAISGLIDGTKNAIDVVKDLVKQLTNMVINRAFQSIVSGLFGSVGGGLGGISLHNLPRYAMGTNLAPGGMAWVGERGPELVNLPRGSQVIPNHKLTGGARGEQSVAVDVGVTVDNEGSLQGYVKKIAQQTTQSGIGSYDAARQKRYQAGGRFG